MKVVWLLNNGSGLELEYVASPITWFLFALGSIVGSFLNVCILRIPEGSFWKHSRSHCPQCEALIPMYLNLPILSYVILRGRTKCCRKPLSIQYPLVELVTALLFPLCYWLFPFIADFRDYSNLDYPNMIRFSHAVVFCCLLLVCSVIDLNHMIIPDVISIPMILASPLVFYIHPDLDWQSSLIGVAFGGGSLYAIAWLYWLVRREVGLGLGDVKLLAAVGGWLGYQAVIPTIFVGSIVGALFGLGAIIFVKRLTFKSAIPFGPFLALGAVVHHLFGGYLREWVYYLHQP